MTQLDLSALAGTKGLITYIFKSATLGDCANGGISSRCDQVTIVGVVDGRNPGRPTVHRLADDSQVFAPAEDRPAVVLFARARYGRILVPATPDLLSRWMAGGTYVAAHDSRLSNLWGGYHALPLHDRTEH
ncbi:hypothetical protein Lfu02_15130 [Longispora fulva]|uniref:Uncharacterized protein n=1 Tax=Longispora fulva TaxID=619741 RepID=A0A8J7KZ88_9ACTN|nr:hypothetical protein [Longispora fulva]MBG6140477.1 hypothetical protein [Longispora fulva]GIG57141.1 hypothetical protein Lfu02_15130 [Longispora fulva]